MAAIARDFIVANTFGSFALLAIFLLGGFIVPKDAIKPWWIWVYWISPLSYGQRAIAVNEFTDSRWREAMRAQGVPETRLQLLSNVSGVFRPRVLTALVGSSGAGKTTLMDVLAELVANPSIIFMDEPTSGLDARAAAIVMRTVRNTVDTGRTVVCTIHQPSYRHADRLLPGGSVKDQPSAVDFGRRRSIEEEKWKKKRKRKKKRKEGKQEYLARLPSLPAGRLRVVVARGSPARRRRPRVARGRFFSRARSRSVSPRGETDRATDTIQDLFLVMGSLYSACIFLGVNNASSIQPVISIERTVYYRERATRIFLTLPENIMISYVSYLQGIVEIPYIMVQTIIFGIITFFMINYERTLGTMHKPSFAILIFTACAHELPVVARESWALFLPHGEKDRGDSTVDGRILPQSIVDGRFLPQSAVDIRNRPSTVDFWPYRPVASCPHSNNLTDWFAILVRIGISSPRRKTRQRLALVPTQEDEATPRPLARESHERLFTFVVFVWLSQNLPVWWLWFYYICPVAWTLRGVITSQLGDVETRIVGPGFDGTVKQYLEESLGYGSGMLGITVVVLIAFSLFFFTAYATSIKVLNYQRR
ncbi:hypothetical protein GW17_00013457 [Ensete ventricosum]|nr:hypothetical protein GW17_00013457 [Ensete ventricosum]